MNVHRAEPGAGHVFTPGGAAARTRCRAKACAADAVPRSHNIPAGPLNAVIARYSVKSGVYVAANGALTGGKTSPNWTRYQRKLDDTWLANAGLGLRYYGKARSSLDYNHLNLANPSFGMLDLALGLEQTSWRYTLNVNNVLDKQVRLDCDGTFCYRNAGRIVNVSASYRF